MDAVPADDGSAGSDGGGVGGGKVPAPFSEVEVARYKAYLLSEMGSWAAARGVYGTLLARHDVDDWAYAQGLAVAEAHVVADELAAAACTPARVAELLAPTAPLCGDAPACAALTAASRGAQAAALLLRATHLELASRAGAAAAGLPSALAAAARDAFAAGAPAFVGALQAYVAQWADKPATFADLKFFLHTFLPPLPSVLAPYNGEAAGATGAAALTGFLSSSGRVLAMPYVPAVIAGSGSDAAEVVPPLRLSFTLDAAVAAPFLAWLASEVAASAFTAADGDAVKAAVVVARDAGIAKEAADSTRAAAAAAAARKSASAPAGGGSSDDEAPSILAGGGGGGKSRKDRRKGKGGKGGAAAAAAAAPAAAPAAAEGGAGSSESTPAAPEAEAEADPHDVAEALKPQVALVWGAEGAAVVAAARSKLRRHATLRKVQRYVRALGVSAGGEAAARAAADALADTWRVAQVMAAARDTTVREALEADDLVLLAAHLLWELAFTGISAAGAGSGADGVATLGDLPAGAAIAARDLLLESAALLEIAAGVSPHNATLRMALVRVHAWLGANASLITQSVEAATRLKHIQRDTLTHAFAPHYVRMYWPEALRGTVDEVVAFHRNTAREQSEFVYTAVRGGFYSRALDLMRLRSRLAESGTLASCRSVSFMMGFSSLSRTAADMGAHLRRVTGLDTPEGGASAPPATLAGLRDNDDRDAFVAWDPPALPLLQQLRFGLNLEGAGASAGAGAGAGASTSTAVVPAGPPATGAAWVARWVDATAAYTTAVLAAAGCPANVAGIAGLMGTMAPGNNGGQYERVLRRVLRDGTLVRRAAVLRGLAAAAEGRGEAAAAAAAELAALDGATRVSGDVGSGAAGDAAVRTGLLGDMSVGCVPLLDTGVTAERVAVRRACGEALAAAVGLAAAAASGAWAGVKPAAEAVASAVTRAADAVVAGRCLPPGSVPSFVPTVTTGGSKKAAGEGPALPLPQPLNIAALAEANLLAQHTLPLVQLAIATAQRAAGAKRGGGGPRAGAGAAAAAAVAAAAGAGEGGGGAAGASEALAECVAAVLAAVDNLAAMARGINRQLQVNSDKATPVVVGGWEPAGCATSFVAAALQRNRDDIARKASGKRDEVVDRDFAAAKTGAAYVDRSADAAAFKQRERVHNTVIHIGASFTNTAARLSTELEHRTSFLARA